jgi:spore coat polysaccharide biosynthesis protein SpsF
MNITASIQARLGSSRLPGKVLKDICGKPMLQWQVERLQKSRLIDNIVVATSINPIDDEIEEFCTKLDICCYRGSEDDVLARIAAVIRSYHVDLHVECFGDSPLIDPQIIDEFIGYYFKYSDSYDYVSSALKTTYPPGLEVTIYPGSVLLETDSSIAYDDPLREHAGYNITRFPERYNLASLEAPTWYFYPDYYLEVDTVEDLEVVRAVMDYFVKRDQDYFSLADIIDAVQKLPELMTRNASVDRRWKVLRNHPNV